VLQVVILQQSRDVKRSRDARQRIAKRQDTWEKGQFTMLVEDTLRSMEAYLSHKQGTTTPEQRTKTFHQKVLRGNVRGAVRYLTEREKGGILYLDDIDENSGDTVQSVLESKHPDAWTPGVNALTGYPFIPDFVDLDITEDTIKVTTRRLSGGAGLGGTDAHALQQWLLHFGKSSRLLRQATADLVDGLANSFSPWAAYRALMAGRLVALDKCPGVRPIGVGETWWRLAAKATLLVSGCDAKERCGIDQLCAGLEAGIKGGIYVIDELWRQHEEEEEWGFLLVDAANAFNELKASKALAPSAVRVKPMIHSRRTAEETKAKEPKHPVQRLSRLSKEERGNLLIQGFWARGTDVIVDVCVTDTDAKPYRSRDPHKVLATQEREKKKKYLQSCLEQRKHFTPFALSTEGLIGREAGELLKRLSL
jgi:hypothetical protein